MDLPGYDAWKLASPYDDMTEEQEQIQNLKHRVAELHSALEECADYFNDHSDVIDGPEGTQLPNKEMRMLQRIEEVL